MEPTSDDAGPPDLVTSCQPLLHNDTSKDTERYDERCESYMENVRKAVQTLKLHTEVTLLASSLKELNRRLQEYHNLDACLLASLEKQRVHEDVLICMHNFPSNENIQKEACDLLTVLMNLSPDIANNLITKDRHQQILHVLTGHLCDEGVQIAALGTLTCFTKAEVIRKKVLYGSGDVIGHVTRAMTAFPETADLQSAACGLLNVLLQDDANFQTDLIKNGDHKLILDALKAHPTREDVTREACRLLHLVTNEATAFLTVLDTIVQKLIQDHVHLAMLNAIRHHNTCEQTLAAAYGVLSVLSFEEDVLHTIGSQEVEIGLLNTLMKYIRNSDIQIHCFNIFANILTYDDELSYDRDEGQEIHWLKQIYIAMAQHREVANVQVACCRTLAQLMELYPDLTENIGEDTANSQDPIHILCFGALLMHHNDASVAVAVFNAIYWLSADNERIQQQLVQKNAYIGVIHGMKVHGADPAVQEAGCRALRGLSIFSQENKEIISWHGDLSDMFRPLFQFPDHLEVVVEAIAVLACLADTELVRTMCLVEQVHERILGSMETHEGSPLLHEVSLEALSILCAADGGTTALNEAGSIERVVASMKTHWNNSVIQRKGLVLLQLLLDDVDLSNRDDLSSDLAKVVVAAMSQNEEEIGLRIEGCVAILILAEKGDFVSVHLVENQAHAHLFYILDHFQDHKKLVDLANECLYVLGCERNLKSQMLLYACEQGFSKGVECLIQLGAEVNVGAGTDTPLCHACCHGDEHTVGLLLRQGVTDLQGALQLTLRQEQHSMVGLILSHFDHQGGIVSWGGLGLGDVRPEWLEPTFLGRAPPTWQVSESGKQMAQKIQRTEQKRAHRAKRHLSAPAEVTSSARRMSLRYSFRSKPRFGNREEFVQKLQENYPQLKSQETDEQEEEEIPRKKGPLSTIKRKFQSLRRRRRSSPAVTTANRDALRKRSDLIRSISTSTFSLFEQDNDEGAVAKDDVAEFVQCPYELREWRETTLTGSNVPFSSLDPRRSKEKAIFRQPQALPGEWQRKSPFRKARRHSESVLMIPHLLRNASHRSLRSLSGSSLQGDGDGDDSSNSSQGGSSVPASDLSTGSALTPRFVAPPRSHIRKRSYTSKGLTENALSEAGHEVLSTIRDDPFLSEDDAFTSVNSTSTMLLETPTLHPVRRCRSVTLGDPMADSHSGQKITHLDLSNNSIRDFRWLFAEGDSALLNRFTLLEKVDFSSNLLTFIPDALFRFFSNLRHFVVAGNQLRHLPPAVLSCSHLTSIDISNNQIENLNLFASRVTFNLKDLNLSHNALQSFPEWLAKTMPRLETLNLSGNQINSLPEEPLILKSLRVLDLSYNHIRAIPDLLLSQTHALETLALSGNEIEVLPSEELASILLKLSVVKLSHNHLTGKEPFYVPKFLLEIKSLRSLDVSYNQLSGLPEPRLWKTTALREINASHNCIKKLSLTQASRHWPTVERLVLSHNKLVELPRDIGQSMSLTSLDVSYNEKLTTIPDEMGRLQKLWELSLDGLKLDLDEGLTRGRTKDLIGYLHEKLKRSVEYYHMKMMVVGYGARGKSTLLRSLMRQRQPDRSLPTVGVVLRDWTFRGRSPRAGSGTVTYTLNTWDFAGQEEFYSTHQCFLSNRALYLVIYNLSKGVSEVETLRPWLVNIQARAPNCPVIVVGTHVDLLPKETRDDTVSDIRQRLSEMCEGPGFPDLKGLTEVNCTQEGPPIDRLRILIKDVLDNFKVKGQHVMGQKIPESYVRLQELLSEEARNLRSSLPIIKHGRLVKIAKDAELDLDEEELQQAVRFLHEAGSLLHYDDAALQLNSLYFIDPEWLCRMMAQVVTVREINPFISKQGIMRRENVRHLFTGKRVGDEALYAFPPSLIPQYLRLLERFEIALPQNEEELLIPSRLPMELPVFVHPIPDIKPSTKGTPEGTTYCLVRRQYELSYTPIGFWSRLLTRILVFVNSLPQLNVGMGRPAEVSYWREGVYVYYGQDAFFLVKSEQGASDVIVIVVPGTKRGARLLSEVVDHVDILMEEWYPGLQEVSPTGESLVKVRIPCPHCHDNGHVFVLEELIGQSDLDDVIECPIHKGQVPLSLLAPEVVLGDMDEKHFLSQEDFTFVQSPENVLGEGTFGCVYRAQYRKQGVAVKIFNKMGDSHPYKMMRQEATILRRLHHPSLVGLVGLGLRPRVVVLELAPLGSLGNLLKSERVRARALQQRIATQVAGGLKFLHDHSIIYRDMKPDNILMFNVSLAAVINAKISDYGISRLATPYGLTLPEGTPGYRGPEVVKGEPYSVQADMYSFGITLYELVTGGQHPFSELGFLSEIDDAVLKGRRVDPVTKKGAAPWPDMEDLIDRCLHPVPDQRPTSTQVLETLKSVELLTLRRAVAVSKGVSVECMLVRGYGENDLEVWVASGEKGGAQLSWLSLTAHTREPKGMMFTGSRILCMEAVGQSNVLLGTQAGTICVYDAWQHCCKHTLRPLGDSILCLKIYGGYEGQDFVFAGLADGRLAIFQTKEIISDSEAVPTFLRIGELQEPLRVMQVDRRSRRLYLGTGSTLHAVRVEPTVEVEESFSTRGSSKSTQLISQLIVQGKYAHVGKKGDSLIEMWHLSKHKLQRSIDLDKCVNSCELDEGRRARVTSMLLVGKSSLWVGTGEGFIILLDSATYQHLLTTRRHTSTVRALAWARVFDQFSMVLAGGLGFSVVTQSHDKDDDDHGYLTMWDPDISQHKRALEEYGRRRQEWWAANTSVSVDPTSASDAGSGSGSHGQSPQAGRRASVDLYTKLAQNKARHPQAENKARQEGPPHRRHSQIPVYQRSDSQTARSPIIGGQRGSEVKRGSLTPNLEYGRPKRQSLSMHVAKAEVHKRASLHQAFSFASSSKTESLEIGKLMKLRRMSASAAPKAPALLEEGQSRSPGLVKRKGGVTSTDGLRKSTAVVSLVTKEEES